MYIVLSTPEGQFTGSYYEGSDCQAFFFSQPKKLFQSLETLDRHNQTHNDIKPQNFLVKFENGPNDLTQIEIALTDFGMAQSDSKVGTPVFASPECFEQKGKKTCLDKMIQTIAL